MKNLMLTLLIVALGGCASAPQPAYDADGREAYFVKCGSEYKSVIPSMYKSCDEQAAIACPGGYLIDDKDRDSYRDINGFTNVIHSWKVVCQ
jgi:hypothetical protein